MFVLKTAFATADFEATPPLSVTFNFGRGKERVAWGELAADSGFRDLNTASYLIISCIYILAKCEKELILYRSDYK